MDGVRILVVDNYDSFTYNLVQYLGEITGAGRPGGAGDARQQACARGSGAARVGVPGGEIRVFRNDRITVAGIREEDPTHVIISPGPCTPNEAGISLQVVRELAGVYPILGVCLGHQSIGQAFGGTVVRGAAPVHGKTSSIWHDGRSVYAGLPRPFVATRYHSLVVTPDLPPVLERTAWTDDGVLMGVRHREYVVEGVQFHPESILTAVGKDLLRNFVRLQAARWADIPAGSLVSAIPPEVRHPARRERRRVALGVNELDPPAAGTAGRPGGAE
jgi:anthranilate synthase/aminodeoxychorismate synthase-like glutamine amidotransferase